VHALARAVLTDEDHGSQVRTDPMLRSQCNHGYVPPERDQARAAVAELAATLTTEAEAGVGR
jgi:hypothetical protein